MFRFTSFSFVYALIIDIFNKLDISMNHVKSFKFQFYLCIAFTYGALFLEIRVLNVILNFYIDNVVALRPRTTKCVLILVPGKRNKSSLKTVFVCVFKTIVTFSYLFSSISEYNLFRNNQIDKLSDSENSKAMFWGFP